MRHGGSRSHYRGPGKGPEAKSRGTSASKGPTGGTSKAQKAQFPGKGRGPERSSQQLDMDGFAKAKPALVASNVPRGKGAPA